MTGPFRIEVADDGCTRCHHDRTYSIIGPDEVAHSVDYGDLEEAESLEGAFNRAYELGRQSALTEKRNPWTSIEERLPTESAHLLVWDAEFGCLTTMYFISNDEDLARMRTMHYTHWMLMSDLSVPLVPVVEQPAAAPSVEPPTIEPPPALNAPAPVSAPYDLGDDIPF